MPHDLHQTIALLERTPATLDALLRTLPESWLDTSEGPGTWTVREVLGHLIDSERTNWLPRARIILDQGESQPFAPFPRTGHTHLLTGKTIPQLLDDFASLRAANLIELAALALQPADLERRGIHPAFGPVTLSQLLATWAIHDLTHISQITRVMAHQYRDHVGPWTAYLGILHRATPTAG